MVYILNDENVCVWSLSCVFVTPWAVVHQLPLPIEFSKQEYWSGLAFPSPGSLLEPGIETATPASPVFADILCDENNRSLMGREEGRGFRMRNTCIPVVDSF